MSSFFVEHKFSLEIYLYIRFMKKVGITGGIGSGKSFIANIIEKMGYPVYYSDLRSKELTNNHPVIRNGLIDLVGENVYLENELNKKVLSDAIFSNDEIRLNVNQIIHPIVRQDFTDWVNLQDNTLVFNEAAILFETGGYKNFDATILVYAPLEIRLKRVLKRDIISEHEVRARMSAQLPDEEKIKLTDYHILNDEVQPLLKQIEDVIKQIESQSSHL